MPNSHAYTDEVRAEYVRWMRYPNKETRKMANEPLTKQEFADKWRVNRSTLWTWEKDPQFKREVLDGRLDVVTPETINGIIAALTAKALSGNVQAIRLLGDWMGIGKDIFQGVESVEEDEDFEDLSDSELEARWKEVNGDADGNDIT